MGGKRTGWRQGDEPTEELLEALEEEGPWGVWASNQIREAWRQRDSADAATLDWFEKDSAARAALAVTALGESFTLPVGHHVYVLYDREDVIAYVGRSSNVLARVGTHMQDPTKRDIIHRVALIACPSFEESARLEMEMIEAHRPRLNTVGIPRLAHMALPPTRADHAERDITWAVDAVG